MSILRTIRQIITRERDDLLQKNTPHAVLLAAKYPELYTHNASQRTLDRKMIDNTVTRYYLGKNEWTYSWFDAKGKIEKHKGSISDWRVWSSNQIIEIDARLRKLTHKQYLDRVSTTRVHEAAIKAVQDELGKT